MNTKLTGFVYVGRDQNTKMASAAAGMRVGNGRDNPPWIVVDHEPQSVILASWPGRLWKVRVLEAADTQPLPYACYTRATAVDVLEELPLTTLFGHEGEAVVEFLNAISELSEERISALADSVDDEAVGLHNVVWNRWLERVDPKSPFLGQDHTGIISIGNTASRSPVGHAPSVLHSQITKLARNIAGDKAFVEDEDEQYLCQSWAKAASCLQHALFSLGVSHEILSPSERGILRRGYERALSVAAR